MLLTETFCLGISHHTAPVAVREAMVCSITELTGSLVDEPNLREAIHEWAVLSTCNRFEVYVQATESEDAGEHLLKWMQRISQIDADQLRAHSYVLRGATAVRHLLRVAAGLDSQVLGEPQILGQVSTAYRTACDYRTVGPYLTAAFNSAVRTGRRARSETAISRHPSSIGSVAVSHIEAFNGPLTSQAILVIGAGEMAELAVNTLRKRGVGQMAIANRTCARARGLMDDSDGDIYQMNQLTEALAGADAVICATAAPHVIVTRDMVTAARQAGSGKSLLLVDIALPRDVEPSVATLPGVTLVNLDALHDYLESARMARESEVPLVEAIVDEEMDAWQQLTQELHVRPLIRELRLKAEKIRRRELARTLKLMGEVDPATKEQVAHLSRTLVNQLLHEPTRKLRQEAAGGERDGLASAVQELFDLAA